MAAKRSSRTKSRSGAKWSEEQYRAAGYGRLQVRLRQPTLEKLNWIARNTGTPRAKLLASLIDEALERWPG